MTPNNKARIIETLKIIIASLLIATMYLLVKESASMGLIIAYGIATLAFIIYTVINIEKVQKKQKFYRDNPEEMKKLNRKVEKASRTAQKIAYPFVRGWIISSIIPVILVLVIIIFILISIF